MTNMEHYTSIVFMQDGVTTLTRTDALEWPELLLEFSDILVERGYFINTDHLEKFLQLSADTQRIDNVEEFATKYHGE